MCSEMNKTEGVFISFEGPEQSGKTTQFKLLEKRTKEVGLETLFTREPGGTEISEKIRELLLDPENTEMARWTDTLLNFAARTQLVEELIRPALKQGKLVLLDRYIDSSIVYQGMARKQGVQRILDMHDIVTGGLMPDLTILFQVDLETSRERQRKASDTDGMIPDRVERESDEFHKVVEKGYEKLKSMFPKRIAVIDGSGSIEEVHAEVVAVCNDRFGYNL